MPLSIFPHSLSLSLSELYQYTLEPKHTTITSQDAFPKITKVIVFFNVGVIDILDSAPAIVSTAGTKHTTDPLSCTAEGCARWSLKALGNTDYTAGHWTHILQSWLTTMGGETISRFVANIKLHQVNKFTKAN